MDIESTTVPHDNKEIDQTHSGDLTTPWYSFTRLLVGDTVRLTPGLLAQFLDGVGVNIVLGIYLSPEAMGLYTLFWFAQTHFSNLMTGWLRTAILRFLSETPSRINAFLRFSFFTVIISAILAGILAVGLSFMWPGSFESSHIVWSIAIFIGASLFLIFQSVLRGSFEQSRFSASSVLLVVIKIGLLFLFLPSATAPVTTALTVIAISYIPVLIWQWDKIREFITLPSTLEAKFEINVQLLWRSLVYGAPLTISLFIIGLLQTGDRYLLASLVSLSSVGVYAFWMDIGLQIRSYRIIFAALNPRLFQLHYTNPAQAKNYVRRLTGYYVRLGAPLLTYLGVVFPPILIWLNIKPEYFSASHLIFYGMGVAFLLGLVQLSGIEREFEEKTMVFVTASGLSILVMVAGVYVLTPLAGLDGTGIATLSGFGLYFVIISYAARTWPTLSDILIGTCSSLCLFWIFHWVAPIGGNLISILLVGLILFVYSLWVLRPIWYNRLQTILYQRNKGSTL